jgi:DNA-binding XRE family transcriptional regulator
METTTDAVEILHRRLFEGEPERLKILEEARANEEIARKIFGLRTKAGLTQTQLGKLVGTTASVICRLEERRSFKNPTLGQRPIPTKIVRSSNSGPTAGSIAPANK